MRLVIIAVIALITAPAIADEFDSAKMGFDPLTVEQWSDVLPVERALARCWMKATNKPYRTVNDVQHLITVDAVKECGHLAGKLKAMVGTSRMEAFIGKLQEATMATHVGAADDENSVGVENIYPTGN